MPYYRQVGDIPRKRHSYVPAEGGLRFEELMGHDGFAQESSLLYHRGSPSAIVAAEVVHGAPAAVTPDLPVLPRHFRTDAIATGSDAVRGRVVLLANEDVRIAWFVATTDSELYRDATGDQLVYVQSGHGVLESSFGAIAVGPGDYVSVPCATTHRWRVAPDDPLAALVLEARGHVARAAQVPHRPGTVPRRARRSPNAICAGPTRRWCATAPTFPCSCAHAPD